MKAIEYEHYITKKATREGLEKGMQEGLQKGLQEGLKKGEERYGKLTRLLIQEKRYDDLERASRDKEYRDKLFSEFQL